MILSDVFIYLLLGLIAGLLAGLLGIGGGIILVPCLYFLFTYLQTGVTHPMHLAIGTSLVTITITSFISMYLYQKRHAVFWPILKKILPGLIFGGILGVLASYLLSGKLLAQTFAVFACLIGIYFLFFKKPYKREQKPENLFIIVSGFIIGILATLLGIGGGVIALPFFIMFFRVPNYSLIGTASATTFVTSLVGAFCYLLSGFMVPENINSIGYIYIPGFLAIAIISIFSVYLGIKLADKLEIKILKKLFGLALIATGIFMFFK
ncbi:MAG: sulfite exporter TauE/SafE family protein [Parachlamydiales bacterium]|nr:sulfite exporter TauE/SafE family protein [Parachlamydiales bacterium]